MDTGKPINQLQINKLTNKPRLFFSGASEHS